MNSSEVIGLLQDSPLFNRVKSSLLAAHLGNTTRVNLEAGQVLLTPGQRNDCIYIVLSGRLRAQLHLDDTRPLALFGLAECVGEISMLDDGHVSAYIIAATDCELLSIPHADAWNILDESLQASHNLLNILAARMRSNNDLLADSLESLQGYEGMSYIDTVTGLYNRRWLSDNLPRLIQRHAMNQQPCAFMLLQADNFGQYHAQFGSLGQDQALRTIAQTMLHCLRPNDVAVHLSEERFAIFLSQTTLEQTGAVTDRLGAEVSTASIVTPSGDALPSVTLAVGASRIETGDTLDTLIARAHAALRSIPAPVQ